MTVQEFITHWDAKCPDLHLYTCWRQAKRYADSYQNLFGWLRSEGDKLHVVAPGLLDAVKKAMDK